MTLNLKDPALLRQQCYVDGAWLEAQGGGTSKVTNPATGDVLGTVPSFGAAETRAAIEAASAAFPAWAARTAKDRANAAARVARPDAGARGRPRDADDGRTGQAARRSPGRGAVRGVVHRVVRRGRQAPLRRRDPRPPAGQAHLRAAAAGRRRRGDHAVELSRRDDHAQGGPRARGGLHVRLQARDADALFRACDGGTRASRRHPQGRVQRDHGLLVGARRRDDVEPHRAQAHVHRLDRESARS